ncbi:esterase/lipase family protein [Mycobacterium sp. NPDC003449]
MTDTTLNVGEISPNGDGAPDRPAPRPLILIRGFGGADVDDERGNAYQGFNDGTVYPTKRGENFIYEGFLLRALKSAQYPYTDATNVIGYYSEPVKGPEDPGDFPDTEVSGTVVIDPQSARRVLSGGTDGTIWIYRYYDLSPRKLDRYGEGLATLVGLIRGAARRHGESFDGVDIVAHSMGGLVVRSALGRLDRAEKGSAASLIHRIVTLGTPHRGIAFQRFPSWLLKNLPGIEHAADELAAFDPTGTEFLRVADWFPPERILTVVGTNYRSYGSAAASLANRISSLFDEGSLQYNRSDGLVKQASAQLPGAPRTFIHKCHGGTDGLVTSRESYEIAMRFFHGTHRVRLWLDDARISRGGDWFGRSEFYFGVSIKPRFVDFELFHQSAEAENCYGPFGTDDLTDGPPDLAGELSRPLAESGDRTTGWAGPDRLIWEGRIDARMKPENAAAGLVFRLDIYVGERDSRGIGFSDNVVFRKQYYVQAFPGDDVALFVHTGEQFLSAADPVTPAELGRLARPGPTATVQKADAVSGRDGQWTFAVGGSGFNALLRIAIDPDRGNIRSPAQHRGVALRSAV